MLRPIVQAHLLLARTAIWYNGGWAGRSEPVISLPADHVVGFFVRAELPSGAGAFAFGGTMDSTTAGRARTFTYESAGRELFGAERGEGWPVVLLHGGLADHRAINLYLPTAPEGVRLITPDVRGSGRSIDPGPLSWSQLEDDVVALLAHLEIERAVIGGTSLGSGIAAAFALSHPERTAGAIFIQPMYAGPEQSPSPAMAAGFAAMHAAATEAVERGIDALAPLYERLPEPIRKRAWAVAGEFDPASCLASTSVYVSPDQPLSEAAALSQLLAPAAVVPGVDAMHPADIADLYATALPHAEVVAGDAPLDEVVLRLCRRAFEHPATAG